MSDENKDKKAKQPEQRKLALLGLVCVGIAFISSWFGSFSVLGVLFSLAAFVFGIISIFFFNLKREKKISYIVVLLSVVTLFIAMSANSKQVDKDEAADKVSSKKAHKNYKLHKLNNIKTTADDQGNVVIEGDTDASDNSVILASNNDIKDSNLAVNDDRKLVKVKDGHFKAHVDIVDLASGNDMKLEAGQTVKLNMAAVENYHKSMDQANYDKMLDTNQIKKLQVVPITIDSKMADYYKSLDDNSDSSSSEDSDPSSYRNDITYDQIARKPDDYEGEKVQFTGEVAQVMEEDDKTQVRLAVGGDYDNMILFQIDNSELDSSKILEDDLLTVYGTSNNTVDYDSTIGGKITVPSIIADQVDNQGKAPDDYGV